MKLSALILICLLLLGACIGGSDSDDGSKTTELAPNRTVSGNIAKVGEVDWYHYRVVEANSLLRVTCNGESMRPEVDFLITVYEENANGERIRLYADHAPENSQLPAGITSHIYIDRPKDIYIAVRDLKDDDASHEKYRLTIDFEEPAEGNESFAQAEPMAVDDPSACLTETIGSVGDVDCFQFDAAANGIHSVKFGFTPFAGGTNVRLVAELYDSDGQRIDLVNGGQSREFQILSYLEAGPHYVLVKDQGQDDFDSASSYSICVETVAVDEVLTNDSAADAAAMQFDAGNQIYSATGALSYAGDQDWYALPIGSQGTTGLKVLNVEFDDNVAQGVAFKYRLSLQDGQGTTLFSHDFNSGSSAYRTQVLAGPGDHALVVKAADQADRMVQAPYEVSVTVADIDDPPETATDGNDDANTADSLTSGVAVTGKVSYRGDSDWYRIEVDTSTPKILEVFMETAGASNVEHYLSLMRDGVIKTAHDPDGADGATELKTSVWVPQSATVPSSAAYLIKICDYQGNEGDDVPYTLQANVVDVPSSVPAGPATSPVYFDEIGERLDAQAVEVELEATSLVQETYPANTTLLDYRTGSGGAITQTPNPDGTTTIEFPWIAGYVDYQGDQDWFQIAMQTLDPDFPDDKWYYDIDVQLVTGADANVEVIWKYYHDPNNNKLLVDRPTDKDGYIGCVGDQDPVDNSAINIDTRAYSDDLWVGDRWKDTFYFAVSDFDYVRLPGSEAANPRPDDDWGYTAPYYFKVTMVYHPGVSEPE